MVNNENQIKSIIERIPKPNIAVIGKTGVGKSSLINAVFQIELAKSGAGKPITFEYTKYAPEYSPIIIYDSPGYEAGKEGNFVQTTFEFLNDKKHLGIEEQIHLVWYLVSSASARFEDFDRKIIEKINEDGIPATIVLTQCDRAARNEIDKLEEVIAQEVIANSAFNKVYDVIEVAAFPLLLPNGQKICEAFGLEKLVETTMERLPEIYSEAVIIAQVVNIDSKRELAWKYISQASLQCFAIGSIPIPFTAPTAAVGTLSYLCNQITVLYGYQKLGIALGVAGITLGGLLILLTSTALDILSNSVPGISVLSGGAAAAYTTASGLAYASTCEKLAKQQISGSKAELKQFLRKSFIEEFDKYINIRISTPNDLVKIGELWKSYKL